MPARRKACAAEVQKWKGVCFAKDVKGAERIVELLSSSEGLTQKEITLQLSASERTVRLWLSRLRQSGRIVSGLGYDLRVPVYSVASAAGKEAV